MGNQSLVITTDRCTNLARAVLSPKANALHVSSIFFGQGTVPFRVPALLLTEKGPQVMNKFFEAICTFLGVNQLKTTAYQMQTNGCPHASLNHYVEEHQCD